MEQFELPVMQENEILARIICDSICMSTYKAVIQGTAHQRVPKDVAQRPVILGHECCGEIISVGREWCDQWKPGDRFALQPALGIPDYPYAPGYSFTALGGCATKVIVPAQVIQQGCLLPYQSDTWFYGSLSEPMSCIIGAFREFYHTQPGIHSHIMGLQKGGTLLIIGGAGPMGIGAVDYALHGDRPPRLVIVTDIDEERIARAQMQLHGTEATALHFINTAGKDAVAYLRELNNGKGFDDILVMAPVKALVEQADSLLDNDGCLNFFAGPTNTAFSAMINFYRVHYASVHVLGTFGGGIEDIREAILLSQNKTINPALMITHVGGLDAATETTLHLPEIPGGKKLIYTHLSMPLMSLADFRKKEKENSFFSAIADTIDANNGLWNREAEAILLGSPNMGSD